MVQPGAGSDDEPPTSPASPAEDADAALGSCVRLATLPAGFAEGASEAQFADWIAEATPDGVVLLGASARARRRLSRHGSFQVLDPHVARASGSRVSVGDAQIDVAPTTEALAAALAEATGAEEDTQPIFVTAALELDVDTTTLSTTLVGREALDSAPESSPNPPVVLSTEIPTGFRNTVSGVRVLGIGEPDDPGDTGLSTVEIREDGTVLTKSIDPDRLGLRALTEVGSSRAETLRNAGFESRAAVAQAPMAEIQDLPGFGSGVATTVQASARAIANDEVVLQGHTALPVSDPLFVDIETDGLHPTVTWLIGVLDGGPEDGDYYSFVDRDGEDPGQALEAFIEWYVSEGQGRTLVAYNGRRFDFPVIRDHLQAYRPGLLADFEQADTFDPYAWAVTEGNAVLPGRTNTLEHVATALGYEPREEGITGAAVARAYRRWMHAPDETTEPDWDRFDRYCEDDTRALATVYRALEDATSEAGSRDRTRTDRISVETTQGTLGEW